MKRAKITEENVYPTALDRLTGASGPEPVSPQREVAAPPSAMIKLSVFVNRQEDAYLENLASTAKFTGGKKISKTKLVETMVRAFRATQLDVRGVKTEEELYTRAIAQLRK